jgi:hypothetical protein
VGLFGTAEAVPSQELFLRWIVGKSQQSCWMAGKFPDYRRTRSIKKGAHPRTDVPLG